MFPNINNSIVKLRNIYLIRGNSEEGSSPVGMKRKVLYPQKPSIF
jgi:hypothetical protein